MFLFLGHMKAGLTKMHFNVERLATEVHLIKVMTEREVLTIKGLFVK